MSVVWYSLFWYLALISLSDTTILRNFITNITWIWNFLHLDFQKAEAPL